MSNYKKTKFTETQVVNAISEIEKWCRAEDLWRELGISTLTFYKWRQKCGGPEVNDDTLLNEKNL